MGHLVGIVVGRRAWWVRGQVGQQWAQLVRLCVGQP